MRDSFRRRIRFIDSDGAHLSVTTDKEIYKIACMDVLKLSVCDSVVCKNTKENIEFLAEHWNEFCGREQLIITFLGERTWSIKPHFHAKIAPNVKKSLDALATG